MAVAAYIGHDGGRTFDKYGGQFKKISLDEGQILYFRSGSYDFGVVAMGMERKKSDGTKEYKVLGTIEYLYEDYDTDVAVYTVPTGYEAVLTVFVTYNDFTGGCRIWIDDGL